jgi:glycosyltransferase involved in cell wall biosynthesis
MQEPLISVIVPCYNHAAFLPDALDSVLAQTYPNWECIIVDDGSHDNTSEVVKRYTAMDARFRYLYQTNAGLASARNAGIRSSVGEFIFPLDSDDKIHPGYFAVAMIKFRDDASIDILYSDAEFFGEKKGKWNIPDYTPENILLQSVIYPGGFFRRKDFDRTKGYDPGMVYGWEDWEFWLSMVELGLKVHQLKEIYFYYRYSSSSMTRKMTDEQRSYLYKRIYLNHHSLYDKLFKNPFQLYWDREYYKNSAEYKTGSVLLYPFRKLKNALKRNGK